MTADQLGVLLLVGLLVAGVVLVWPSRRRSVAASVAAAVRLGAPGVGGQGVGAGVVAGASWWHEDPLVIYRTWRLRKDPAALLAGVLALLDGMAPALALGLTPARALSISVAATLPSETTVPSETTGRSGPAVHDGSRSAGRGGVTELERLVGSLAVAADRGTGLADVWAEWARLTRSADIAFVASAWSLSEHHGAPLAVAVDRAAAGLRESQARRRRVAVAVAGPRATVIVLTVLPLTGPAFGLACGIDPVTLYLGSPVATAALITGLALIAVGRLWCSRM
ncbi:MAG: hypothetical protein ABI336_02425, partial [Humibacillus sp.]